MHWPYEIWAPWQRELIPVADRSAVYLRPFYMLPVHFSWEHRTGVTLRVICDSMSLMPPFLGEGASIAMFAALKLGLALASVRGRPLREVEAKVAEYELKIRPLALTTPQLLSRIG